MTITPYPNKQTIDNCIATDEPLIAVIAFDGEQSYIAALDEGVEHNILLNKCGISPLDIDKYFRIIVDSDGADWTFVCPQNYKNITDRCRRIKAFYNDGFSIISAFLLELGYLVRIDIPKRYRRYLDDLARGD